MVVVVDFANFFFRSVGAWLRGRDPAGEGDGYPVAYMVLRSLGSCLSSLSLESGTTVVVALEGGGTEKRRAIYAGYKSSRKRDAPGSLAAEWKDGQLSATLRLLSALPVVPVFVDGFEADDVAAAIASRASACGEVCVVVTNDGDAAQLQALLPGCRVWDPSKKDYLVLDSSDVVDAQPHVFKALVGDPSDCVPSVCGPVTARKLLSGPIEEAVAWFLGPHRPKKGEVDPPETRREAFERNVGLVSLLPPSRAESLPWLSHEEVLAAVDRVPVLDVPAFVETSRELSFSGWPGESADAEVAKWSRVAAVSARWT